MPVKTAVIDEESILYVKSPTVTSSVAEDALNTAKKAIMETHTMRRICLIISIYYLVVVIKLSDVFSKNLEAEMIAL